MAMDKVVHLYSQDEEKIKDLINKKGILENNRIERQWNQYTDQLEKADRMRIDPAKFPQPGSAALDNDKYQADVEKGLPFINSALSKIISVLPRNLYLIGGATGHGKSTTVANIIIPILQSNSRILVIANEENRADVYSRVACRTLGYSFTLLKTGKLHSTIRAKINEEVTRLESLMTVCGSDFQDNPDMVSTPEGIQMVIEYFSAGHDAILIDYYQNISHSNKDDRPEPYVHQEKFAYWLNGFKNTFSGPIFVMSQMLKAKEKSLSQEDFKGRVEGRKIIANFAQYHIELIPDFENYTTKFKFYKERFGVFQGKSVTMGFDRENQTFVQCDSAFKAKSAQWISEKMALEQDAETTKDDEVITPEDNSNMESVANDLELNFDD